MAPILSEEESALDPYTILEVPREASEKDIQRSYRKKSLKCHPDRNPSPEAAIQFRQISLSLEILLDVAKRNYIDNKQDADRAKRDRYAGMEKKRKDMVDALVAREEEAKRAKVELQERRKAAAEEEAIKDAGKRMLEEAQRRAMAAASASASSSAPAFAFASRRQQGESSTNPSNGHGNGSSSSTSRPHGDGHSSHGNEHGDSQPEITPTDLTLILSFPSTSNSISSASSSSISNQSAEEIQSKLESRYGPIEHLIVTEPPPQNTDTNGDKAGKKKKSKSKGKKAVVEFKKWNWGGCWACWKDHSHSELAPNTQSRAIEEGVKVKFVSGEIPNWITWAERKKQSQSQNGHANANGTEAANGGSKTGISSPLPTSASTSTPTSNPAPSFDSAPDFGSAANGGGLTMADLLATHQKNKDTILDNKRENDEFESMTLLRMRQLERERLEAQIRAEEGDD